MFFKRFIIFLSTNKFYEVYHALINQSTGRHGLFQRFLQQGQGTDLAGWPAFSLLLLSDEESYSVLDTTTFGTACG
jgi:hypothetical protein